MSQDGQQTQRDTLTTPVGRNRGSYSPNNPFAVLVNSENQSNPNPQIQNLTNDVSSFSLDTNTSPAYKNPQPPTNELSNRPVPTLSVQTSTKHTPSRGTLSTPIIQVDPPVDNVVGTDRPIPPPLPPPPTSEELNSPILESFRAASSTRPPIAIPVQSAPQSPIVSSENENSARTEPTQTVNDTDSQPHDDILAATNIIEPGEESGLLTAEQRSRAALEEEEAIIASLPPSPNYTFLPLPGELSIPDHLAIDPLNINENTPTQDPPEYTELSPEAAHLIMRPQFSQTGGNISSASDRPPLPSSNRPPATPLRPPTRPPRSSRSSSRTSSSSPGRSTSRSSSHSSSHSSSARYNRSAGPPPSPSQNVSSGYHRPNGAPPGHTPASPTRYERPPSSPSSRVSQGVVHAIVAPPPLPQRRSSSNNGSGPPRDY
ncbi:hypothetical protein CANARDRAFT_9506 [[Candida] arabinofermentans NRRL YB-2248]|uniref:Uncharacterized protein n=1 Tax=[Candida] arabinofermentans NRRL YB-2248 TaxID=983967 RepID=A0A1E4SVG6_9ASCO|nr:hypothetical protein CANARDRAFT_9506 [[Candida] arabinofermentans NRRL YB-2248]